MKTTEELGFHPLYSGMRSDYLRCNRLRHTVTDDIPWYAEAFQTRLFCDEGYYEIGDDGRLYKLYRPDASFLRQERNVVYHDDPEDVTPEQRLARVGNVSEVREDTNYNGLVEFYGQCHRTGLNSYRYDTFFAQFLNGQLIAIWKRGAFGDIITTQPEWEELEKYKLYQKQRAAKLAAMSDTEREAYLAAESAEHKKRTEALGALMAGALYAHGNRSGFMRKFLWRTVK